MEELYLQKQELQAMTITYQNRINENQLSMRELVSSNEQLFTSNGFLQREICSQKQTIESYKKTIKANESALNENRVIIEKLERERVQGQEEMEEKEKKIKKLEDYKKQIEGERKIG